MYMVCLAVGSTAGAAQDARAWPSAGFRPPFGLGRVTLERPKVTKGLFPRQSAGFASVLGSEPTSDGPPQMALWPTPSMAPAKARFEHPCSRAKSGSSCARPDPIWPLPAAATPSSLMAPLTLPLTLGGLEGEYSTLKRSAPNGWRQRMPDWKRSDLFRFLTAPTQF